MLKVAGRPFISLKLFFWEFEKRRIIYQLSLTERKGAPFKGSDYSQLLR
jgi:hypothetical protein